MDRCSAETSDDPETIRAARVAMDVIGWYVIVPLAVGALTTGVVIALGTRWWLFQHHWVIFSLASTAFAAIVLVQHMPSVTATADFARDASHAASPPTDNAGERNERTTWMRSPDDDASHCDGGWRRSSPRAQFIIGSCAHVRRGMVVVDRTSAVAWSWSADPSAVPLSAAMRMTVHESAAATITNAATSPANARAWRNRRLGDAKMGRERRRSMLMR